MRTWEELTDAAIALRGREFVVTYEEAACIKLNALLTYWSPTPGGDPLFLGCPLVEQEAYAISDYKSWVVDKTRRLAMAAAARERDRAYEAAFQKEHRRFRSLCSLLDRAYEQEMRRG